MLGINNQGRRELPALLPNSAIVLQNMGSLVEPVHIWIVCPFFKSPWFI
jgi:hypothetical protein